MRKPSGAVKKPSGAAPPEKSLARTLTEWLLLLCARTCMRSRVMRLVVSVCVYLCIIIMLLHAPLRMQYLIYM